MIATNRRMAMHDFLLVALSVVVITLSTCSTPTAHQTVEICGADGNTHRYSLALHDPALLNLRHQAHQWTKQAPWPELTLAKWRAELCEFYAARTEAIRTNTDVVAVSFTAPTAPADDPYAQAMARQHQAWIREAQRAQQVIQQLEAVQEQRRALRGPVPIVFGEVTTQQSTSSLMFAVAAGFCIAALFAVWTRLAPSIGLIPADEAPEILSASEPKRRQSIQLSIPNRWVRVHQPASVIVRRAAYLMVVATALISLVG
jgi:hypothetical protein